MSCAQILKMTSVEWILYFNEKTHLAVLDNPSGLLRAIATYGKCYDARTDTLAAALAKSGRGPSKSARADFVEFEKAVKSFTAKAQSDTQPPADEQHRAYAALYEKQFRYAFYQSYEQKTPNPQPPAVPAAPAATAQASADADPLTKAKNHFGELLDALPDEQMHELHAAFGKVLGPHAVTNETRLAVYRYAIFLLEPPVAKPFAPPPF